MIEILIYTKSVSGLLLILKWETCVQFLVSTSYINSNVHVNRKKIIDVYLFQKVRQPGYKISIVFISIFECIKNHICLRVEQTVAEIYYIMISYYTFSL